MNGFKCGLAAVLAWMLLGVVANAAVAPNDARRNITEHDLFHFQWIGDPQLSGCRQ